MSDSERLASELGAVVGPAHVSGVSADRDSYGDLTPSLVVWPAAAPEVARILQTCRQLGAQVGVAGARTRRAAAWDQGASIRVALNTRRMTNILDLDETALTVRAQCGVRLRNLEGALSRVGLTLGFLPVELGESTLGGLLAEPPALAYTPLSGRLIDCVLGVSVARVDGSVIHTRVAPRRATGPDLARLYLGGGAALGVLTDAVLKVQRTPELVLPMLTLFPTLAAAAEAARRLLELGVRPARLRVINQAQANHELGEPGYALPAVCIAALAGPAPLVDVMGRRFADIVAKLGGDELPQKLADAWWARQQEPQGEATAARAARGTRMLHSAAPALLTQLADTLGPPSADAARVSAPSAGPGPVSAPSAGPAPGSASSAAAAPGSASSAGPAPVSAPSAGPAPVSARSAAPAPVWLDRFSLHNLELWAPRGTAAANWMNERALPELARAAPPWLDAIRAAIDPAGVMLTRGPLSEPPPLVGDADVTR